MKALEKGRLQPMYAKVREHGAPVQGERRGEEAMDLAHNQRHALQQILRPGRMTMEGTAGLGMVGKDGLTQPTRSPQPTDCPPIPRKRKKPGHLPGLLDHFLYSRYCERE